ncbi:NotI family restriction endonuclease [Thalassospira alkalitolerans]|uniref:NotI family restriction endonuclease n=1 Tax=Thalassospira alkalitolerans TaxID=1293890 RepID=UPI003AA94A72
MTADEIDEKSQKNKRFGIGEIYGQNFVGISNDERKELIDLDAKLRLECPFLVSFPDLAPNRKKDQFKCSKSSGVCSIRNFSGSQNFGPLTATCPTRFYENGTVFREIGRHLLGDEDARIAKEIPFLESTVKKKSATKGTSVGKIDMVMASTKQGKFSWCAVELQAVYFSGTKMEDDYPAIRKFSGNGVPMPHPKGRRPDYRSSGPKRLMPQLQTKVPTLRRWGIKLAIVVDRPFFESLSKMKTEEDISNCDIAWFVVSFDEVKGENRFELVVDSVAYTTLEESVVGLTAGKPMSRDSFEDNLKKKMGFDDQDSFSF